MIRWNGKQITAMSALYVRRTLLCMEMPTGSIALMSVISKIDLEETDDGRFD